MTRAGMLTGRGIGRAAPAERATGLLAALRRAAPIVLCSVLLAACSAAEPGDTAAPARACAALSDAPVRIAGGKFTMGQDNSYPEEGPARTVAVDPFWIDPHEVTNRQFAVFVAETGHVTAAEKPVDPAQFGGVPAAQIPPDMLKPGSAVFTPPDAPAPEPGSWWRYVPGANWKKPFGPGGANAVAEEPVVHLAWEDMQAYARWRGGRLPTETEWEFAASAGAPQPRGQPAEANSWQGLFPVHNEGRDGFGGLAPVGCYKANAFGLYDMIGNVWEVTATEFGAAGGGGATPAPRTIKGGSYLCAPNYCQRYRSAARQGQDAGLGSSHVGFRLAYDRQPASSAAGR